MVKDDAGSDGWYQDPYEASVSGTGDGTAWTYGKEAWCNLQGRYTYIVAHLTHLVSISALYNISLCQLGIMGTEYVRSQAPPTEVELAEKSTKVITIVHITSALSIGNTLQINLRQQS